MMGSDKPEVSWLGLWSLPGLGNQWLSVGGKALKKVKKKVHMWSTCGHIHASSDFYCRMR